MAGSAIEKGTKSRYTGGFRENAIRLIRIKKLLCKWKNFLTQRKTNLRNSAIGVNRDQNLAKEQEKEKKKKRKRKKETGKIKIIKKQMGCLQG